MHNKTRRPTRKEVAEKEAQLNKFDPVPIGGYPVQEKPKSYSIVLESDNPQMVVEFSNITNYKVADICHNLVRLCEDLRINNNTLTVVEEVEGTETEKGPF